MKKEFRIAFTGGGTGGHIYPLVAIAEELKTIIETSDVNFSMYYFGFAGIYANDVIGAGMKIINIIPVKIRRYFSVENIIDFIKFPFALIQSFFKVFMVMPDVLVSKGGTGAFPVVLACWLFRIPIMVHESDSIPGASNKLSFKFAKRFAVSFSKTLEIFQGEKVALTGNPIRRFLRENPDGLKKEDAKKLFGFDPSFPMILVLGGSQGSEGINDFMLDNATNLVSKYQILHQAGHVNFEKLKTELAVATKRFLPEQRERYKTVNFLRADMRDALIAADVVVSRAGSGAIFEIAAFGKPSILIPLKDSSSDHQLLNAYEYSKSGGCVIIEEDNLSSNIFLSQISSILEPGKYNKMSQGAISFSKPDAASIIAQELAKML
jgi:UDP-N-acetylglucosamine--N-acetylmuramyl-(pentapeptide) pyrophosphoryl-undecaprenol N-acetylglucosamine transferase